MPSPTSPTDRLPRYGCQEFREDSDRVIGDRAEASVANRYYEHMRTCSDCRRADRILRAAYLGPILPTVDEQQKQREFEAILRRRSQPSQARRIKTAAAATGVIGLSAAAAVLAVSLFAPGAAETVRDQFTSPVAALEPSDPITARAVESTIPDIDDHRIDRSQTFGRIVAGDALLVDDEGNPISAQTMAVGTQFETGGEHPMQMVLVGKILASVDARSTGKWTKASSSMIELGLTRGTIAIRYDRQPTDPILQVRTPTALVRVVGTVFTVAVDDAGHTVVSVLRGEVEVLDPDDERLLAEVDAGFLYNVADSSFGELGRTEVAAALPLSNETRFGVNEEKDPQLADGEIPNSWAVPGLGDDPATRTLDHVIDPNTAGAAEARLLIANSRRKARKRAAADEGEHVLAELLADVEAARREENRQRSLERCRELYASPETRFRAANCFSRFMEQYGDDPASVEALLLIGMLRMDFAHDYQSAEIHFQKFLERAPWHERAELAMYKLVLCSVEAGKVPEGRKRGRAYLERYPDGRYVGLILQRLPELKSAI